MGSIFAALLALLALSPSADSTRIRGSWKYSSGSRLKYLTKFGVQEGHEVVAYGRSLRSKAPTHIGFNEALVLAFVPSSTWEDFYKIEKKSKRTCEEFMAGPFNYSWSPDTRCSIYGKEDLYRVVPCDFQQECLNQFGPPVPGSNLTFHITSPKTQFYYLFLVGCHQNYNTTDPCRWLESDKLSIKYNIHIVNQDPTTTKKHNPFIYEFSYDLIGMMIVYIIFSCIYFTVIFFHLTMHSCICTPHGYKHHRLTLIFSVSLVLETLHVILVMTHYCVFSGNGVGVKALFYIGQAVNFLSDWLLILVLILIGKGWQITTATLRWKKITLVVWILYIVMSAIFFVWIVVQESVFPLTSEESDVYQSWAGGLYMAYRLLLLLYILWEMRQIYLIENRRFKLVLYCVLAVLYLVWFCHLPVAVIIASILNPLERARVIVVFILTFDLMINLVMVLLMCPKWSQLYFQFSSHLNSLTRVTMRRMKSGLTRYHAVSNSPTSEEY